MCHKVTTRRLSLRNKKYILQLYVLRYYWLLYGDISMDIFGQAKHNKHLVSNVDLIWVYKLWPRLDRWIRYTYFAKLHFPDHKDRINYKEKCHLRKILRKFQRINSIFMVPHILDITAKLSKWCKGKTVQLLD